MVISRIIEIDYGHTLNKHFGYCNQIHGHRGKIECFFKGKIIENKKASNNGMVMDFSICKEIMMETIHKQLDHGFAIDKNDNTDVVNIIEAEWGMIQVSTLDFIKARNKKVLLLEKPPTAEVLAEYFFNEIKNKLKNTGIKLMKLIWWETPNNKAIYEETLILEKHNNDRCI